MSQTSLRSFTCKNRCFIKYRQFHFLPICSHIISNLNAVTMIPNRMNWSCLRCYLSFSTQIFLRTSQIVVDIHVWSKTYINNKKRWIKYEHEIYFNHSNLFILWATTASSLSLVSKQSEWTSSFFSSMYPFWMLYPSCFTSSSLTLKRPFNSENL